MLSDPSEATNAMLVVVPWSMFGTQRLYVNTADGKQVGWVDLKTGRRSLIVPELASAFEIAVSDADDAPTGAAGSHTPRRALDQLIEFALIAGQASLDAPESMPEEPAESRPEIQREVRIAADNRAEESANLMRHAYRGKCAYSSWELGPCGKRLVEEDLNRLVSPDPRWAYLNSSSVGEPNADMAHLFA
jgi:hypothetical protein